MADAGQKDIKKINSLLEDIKRNGALHGIGKPELLKHRRSGLYSRRLDEANRLVYDIDELQNIKVMSGNCCAAAGSSPAASKDRLLYYLFKELFFIFVIRVST